MSALVGYDKNLLKEVANTLKALADSKGEDKVSADNLADLTNFQGLVLASFLSHVQKPSQKKATQTTGKPKVLTTAVTTAWPKETPKQGEKIPLRVPPVKKG